MGQYPPSDRVMTRRCTVGLPSSLYPIIGKELVEYLNQPGLSAKKLFEDFSDTVGSFYEGGAYELIGDSDGEFLSWKYAPGWRKMNIAEALARSTPSTAREIMSVPGIGPDHFYDMFRCMLLHTINRLGVCLPVFRWWDHDWLDGPYLKITQQASGDRFYVKVLNGIAIDLTANTPFFVFPAPGRYTLQLAIPRLDYYDPKKLYQPSDLRDATFQITVDIPIDVKILPISLELNRLVIYLTSSFGFAGREARIAVVPQKTKYSTGKFVANLYNRYGRLCQNSGGTAGCGKFAAQRQEDLENPPIRSISLKDGEYYERLNFYGLSDGEYKVLYYSDVGALIVIATVINLKLDSHQYRAGATLGHLVEFGNLRDVLADQTIPLPSKAFIHGDIIRQYQQDTNECGTFSLALAASYWDPFTYNTLKHNGRWVAQYHGDWKIGTWQGHMCDKAWEFGFYGGARVLDKDSTSRDEGIRTLKRWIACGIPVIVNIDEEQDTSSFSGEHYKVLVGYDDLAELGYYKADGTEIRTRGALYFANPGAKGLDEPDNTARNRPVGKVVDGIANSRRENHELYQRAPIGNDVDSYKAFFYKWKHGGVAPFTDDLWYLPFFPFSYQCGKCGTGHRITSDVGQAHWSLMVKLVSAF
ncbi:MAG: C39 family peptidase [Candidatus Hodarchaeota archaeon]